MQLRHDPAHDFLLDLLGERLRAEEIEKEVVRRIMPELHDVVRRAVREAVLQAFAGAGRRGPG